MIRRIVARRFVLALTAVTLLAASVLAQPAAQAGTAGREAVWPRQVYAPYFETWTSDSIPAIAAKSGARFFSLAFLQTAKKGSCALTWNGTKSEPVPGPRYRAQIAALRRLGGDVMPTFGGFSADSTGTEIADSCTSVGTIAADYERVIASYHVTTLDMGAEAITALRNVHRQLAALYPWSSQRRLWAMEGTTILPGIDDYPGKTEITYLSDTRRILSFARAHGLGLLSIWAIQRDNGGCPGTIDSDSCSGIKQPAWAFSHLLEPVTRFF